MKSLLGLLVASIVTIQSFSHLKNTTLDAATKNQAETLYIPNGTGLELMSFGYQRFYSHLLWFQTISYFAKHYRSDRDYRWLSHMCDLVIRLNPDASYVYRFCGSMLAWEGNQPQAAIEIFTKATVQFPDDWLFFYLRGFIYVFFLQNEEAAMADFVTASKKPEVDPFIVRLASKKILNLDSPEAAIEFLQDMIRNAPDQESKNAFETRLAESMYEKQLRTLESAVENYRHTTGNFPQSISILDLPSEFVQNKFRDPWGGQFYLEPETGVVKSTSNRKRPKLYWKKARKESL